MARHYAQEIPSYERVHKYEEYWEFVRWMGTPTPLRKPASQRDFAKEHSMHETTLSRWRRMNEFVRDVEREVARYLADHSSDVAYSLLNRIFKDGNATEVREFRSWAHQWIPDLRVQHSGSVETSTPPLPEAEKLAKEYDEKLKQIKTK